MAKRLLSLIAACALIGAAFAYRSSRGDAGTDRGGGGEIVCAEELGPVCEAVPGALVEPAAETADRLLGARSARQAGVAGWITAGPWPDMVDASRAPRPPLFAEPRVLAGTPLVAVTRAGGVPAACGTQVSWRCLGDAAQDPSFRLAGDPSTEPAHLFVRAAAASGFVGDDDFAINDLDELPDAAGWLDSVDRSLDRAVTFGAPTLEAFLVARGSAQVFLTTGAAFDRAGALPGFASHVPSPTAVLISVIAAPRGTTVDIDRRRITDALVTAGWKAPPFPPDEGLPSPGVLFALRGRLG